jgi:hypothetical protein
MILKYPDMKRAMPHQDRKPGPPQNENAARKGQVLRLNERAWKQLKLLAIDRGLPVHSVLIEAVNDLFEKYGRAREA